MDGTVTVSEAARVLGVSRTKVWKLVSEGELSAVQNPLDKREKLIPIDAVNRLRGARARPYPRTIGLIADADFRSREAREYMRAHRKTDAEC